MDGGIGLFIFLISWLIKSKQNKTNPSMTSSTLDAIVTINPELQHFGLGPTNWGATPLNVRVSLGCTKRKAGHRLCSFLSFKHWLKARKLFSSQCQCGWGNSSESAPLLCSAGGKKVEPSPPAEYNDHYGDYSGWQ